MLKAFPPLDPPLFVTRPAVVIDAADRLAVWYLPRLLAGDLEVGIPARSPPS